MTETFAFLAEQAANCDNRWSIGSFGAIGEFIRDDDEPADVQCTADQLQIITARGGIRIAPTAQLKTIAWDSLSADGENWGHAIAFCCPLPTTPNRVIMPMGADTPALRPDDREHLLFDLGVGAGAITMALRTRDAALIAALEAHAGQPLHTSPILANEVLRAQPHRVLLSPAGRVEVYQPIPLPDGKSPEGPHTHLIPRLIAKDRPHGSNTPIPTGWQAALYLHPRSPWQTKMGERHAFRSDIDAAFKPILDRFGSAEDRAVEEALKHEITTEVAARQASWPKTRRGRTKARIVLRRLAAAGDTRVAPWRALYDRAPIENEQGENA